jgi:hypothetical protein
MAKPRSCPMILFFPDTLKVEFLGTTQTMVRPLSADEAAIHVLQLIRTSLYGKKYIAARMTSLL